MFIFPVNQLSPSRLCLRVLDPKAGAYKLSMQSTSEMPQHRSALRIVHDRDITLIDGLRRDYSLTDDVSQFLCPDAERTFLRPAAAVPWADTCRRSPQVICRSHPLGSARRMPGETGGVVCNPLGNSEMLGK